MRSTSERMELLKKRTDEIKERHNEKKRIAIVISSYSLCIVLIASISALICNLNFDSFEQMPIANTASIFTNKYFLGYIVVGILAFLLGISVTLLCDMLHKKRSKERNDGGTDR